jgi:serine/threonine-protein kinase ATR
VHKNDLVWKALIEIICHVANEYPHQALWTMIAGSQSKDAERKKRFGDITNRLKTSAKSNPGVSKIVDQTLRMAKELLYLCDFPVQKETQLSLPTHFPRLTSLANGELILPLQSSISVKMPGDYRTDTDHRAFEKDLPRIVGFDPKVDVMNSLQKPRKLVIIASDGNQYPFLCKPKDDLRKDARLMEFDAMINNLLQSNSESRKRNLYIRTYSVITLNEECGLIEWVPNTTGLRHILHKLYHAKDIALYTSEVQKNLDKARANPRNAAELFETLVLSEYPSVFHEWFIETFPEPSAWLRARLAYAHTLAVMSMVGHVLGLGDRHGENILFDSESGDVVHVDLNCLFDKATLFEIPERVPFRLTHNLVDALGVTGCEGVFRRVAEITMGILRDNKDSLMSVLEAMVHDPLVEWCVDDRHKASKHSTSTTSAGHHSRMMEARMAEARNSLDPVMQKLNGKLRRNNAEAGGPMSRSLGWTSAYSTNTLVDALIRDATSNQLLGQMYAGWASYL